MRRISFVPFVPALVFGLSLGSPAHLWAEAIPRYFWQHDYAMTEPTGTLEWMPQQYVSPTLVEARYIDYEGGNDNWDGLTPSTAWRHHPDDVAAPADLQETARGRTYIFKRGSIYRGTITPGTFAGPAQDVTFCSLLSWGEGEAVLSGAERVLGPWRRARTDEIPGAPSGANVWVADLPVGQPKPHLVWRRAADGSFVRLPLARHPNWSDQTNPRDPHVEWWEWTQVTGTKKPNEGTNSGYVSIDAEVARLRSLPTAAVREATVWQELFGAIVTPYPDKPVAYDPETGALTFGRTRGGGLIPYQGCRYYLEGSAYFLDQPGEHFVLGDQLCVVLPDGADGSGLEVEVAAREVGLHLVDAANVEVAGLTLRHFNISTPPGGRMSNYHGMAAIHLDGRSRDVVIRHNTFSQVTKAVLAYPRKVGDVMDRLSLRDNDVRETEHNAFILRDGDQWDDPSRIGEFGRVEVLRNRLAEIGRRPWVHDEGHAIEIFCAQLVHVAGNIIHRPYGSGIWCLNGKNENRWGTPARRLRAKPFQRVLIHQNQVTDALLHTSDWGGIASWVGGPAYVYNNHVGGVSGYKHFGWRLRQRGEGLDWPSNHGLAIYFDHQYKGYAFNNVLWGYESSFEAQYGNAFGFFEANGFMNVVVNNTITGTIHGVGKWQGYNGHNRSHLLGNIMEGMGEGGSYVKQNYGGSTRNDNPLGLAMGEGRVDVPTLAYAHNVFAGRARVFGGAGAGVAFDTMDQFTDAYTREGALNATAGEMRSAPVLPARAQGDFRPIADTGRAVAYFIPWSLADTVGEWHFRLSSKMPEVVVGEHFNLGSEWYAADMYVDIPRHDLRGVGVTADDYEPGVLEDWCAGALRLKPTSALVASHPDMTASRVYSFGDTFKYDGADRPRPDLGKGPLTAVFVARFAPGTTGAFTGKINSTTGWLLGLDTQGRLELRLKGQGPEAFAYCTDATFADDRWRHVVVELDRARPEAVAIWVDGVRIAGTSDGTVPTESLDNDADFIVGAQAGLPGVAGVVDFLKVARSTLAASDTTAEELFAWELQGPNRADFAGRLPAEGEARPAGALLAR
jgi:hypothetical protein